MTKWREALTSTGAEAQMRAQAQSWVMPNVFNVGNVAKRLIWTRMILMTLAGAGFSALQRYFCCDRLRG
jgi:hypothetical protein